MDQAFTFLGSLERFGINLGLERITCLLGQLGNPHHKFKSIHIAGTNGKGSTAAMIASILKEAGYKVGLYTSPHLFDYRERMKINGKDISKREFSHGLNLVKDIVRNPRLKSGELFSPIHCGVSDKNKMVYPTIFEVLTAVAFWYFAKKKVDYAVVEVGLGGRLDATNVITPLVSVITNIDHDHTEVLGKTLSKIAGEKAAIIKPGVPVVTAENKTKPLRVIEKTCRKNESKLFVIEGRKPRQTNMACALSALLLAKVKVSKTAIDKGLQRVSWPGRFQPLSKKPLIIVDGAHNPAGARALRVTIEEMYPRRKFTLIFGMQKTKDYKGTLKELRPVIGSLIIARSSHNQARDPRDLFNNEKSSITHSVQEALVKWDKQTPLLVTGSLFLVADALRCLDAHLRA